MHQPGTPTELDVRRIFIHVQDVSSILFASYQPYLEPLPSLNPHVSNFCGLSPLLQ